MTERNWKADGLGEGGEMSIWHHVNSEYIDVDHTVEEVNLLIGADDFGNEYVILTFAQVKKIYEQIKGEK